MAKIKVTENELKEIISESVENVLNEDLNLWDRNQSFGSNLRNLPGKALGAATTVQQNLGDAAQAIYRGGAGNAAGMQGDINQIKNRSKYMTYSRDDLIGQIAQRDKQIATLTSQKTAAAETLKRELDTYIEKSKNLTNQVNQLTAEKNNLTAQVNQLTRAKNNLTAQLTQARTENQQMAARLKPIDDSRNQLKNTNLQTTQKVTAPQVPAQQQQQGRPTLTPGNATNTAQA